MGLREALQGLTNFVEIWQVSGAFQDFGIPHLAGFVNHERRALGDALKSPQVVKVRSVGLARLTIEVAEQREVQMFFFFPLLLRKGAIHTDAKDLGIEIRVVVEIVPYGTEFCGTHAGKGKGDKEQEDIFLPT